ncbi:MAG: tyrosine-type recombinase/integrase [Candidatus Aminicenantes bacterium]|nr:tyrosine-type recombinase/integrase [Candidatus Aminicenantes bacterium]
MGIYIRNNRYYFKKEIHGKKYYRALKLKRGQEALLSARLKQVEEEVLAKHFGISYSPNNQISFLDYCKKYLDSKKYKNSWDRDKQRLLIIGECLGDPLLSCIGKNQIEKLEKFLFARNLKPSTVNRYFELLKHLFNLAIEDRYISENPCRYYQKFIEDGYRRALSKEELERILTSARKLQEKPKSYIQSIIYDLIVLALNTGMRLSEILNLRKSYIKDDVILYPISETKYRRRVYAQNSKVKVICLNEIALSIIKKMKGDDDFVFPIKWRVPNVIRKTITKIRKSSKVNDFTFHQLRHTTSTWLSSQVSLSTAKTILGHSDLKTTLKYTHPEIEEQRKGVAKIGEYFREFLPK